MNTSGKLRNITVFTLIFLVFAMPILVQAQENDQALKLIPDDTLFCIRINNLNKSMAQMDQFMTGVYPISISAMVNGLLPSLLGSPELAGLNLDGSITAFGTIFNNQTEQSGGMPNIFTGILVPVTNYQEFIDGIANKTPADDNGIVKLTALQNVLVTQLNNYALATWETEYDNLVEYKKIKTSLGMKLDSSELKLATTEPVWIYGNIEQAAKTFAPMLNMAIEGVKSELENIPAGVTGIETSQLQNIANMYVSILDTFMTEVKSVSLSINPSEKAINITNIVNTLPGTKMAKLFSSSSGAKANNLLKYIDDGAMMSFAFSMNSSLMTESIDLQMNLLSMFGDMISQDEIEKMTAISKQVMECVSGDAVYTFSEASDSDLPFNGKYLIAVKEEAKFKDLINKSNELMMNSGFLKLYKDMGLMDAEFKVDQNVETYKGVSIDLAKLTIKMGENGSTEQAQLLNSMYGEGFEYRWGVTNGLFAATFGDNSEKMIHELIDQIQSGQPKQIGSETQTAISLIPGADKADFYMTMNIIRLMKLGFNMTGQVLPVPLPNLDEIPTKSNLVIAGSSGDGKMTINVALPSEHIQEIMTAIMSIIQAQMQTTAKL